MKLLLRRALHLQFSRWKMWLWAVPASGVKRRRRRQTRGKFSAGLARDASWLHQRRRVHLGWSKKCTVPSQRALFWSPSSVTSVMEQNNKTEEFELDPERLLQIYPQSQNMSSCSANTSATGPGSKLAAAPGKLVLTSTSSGSTTTTEGKNIDIELRNTSTCSS